MRPCTRPGFSFCRPRSMRALLPPAWLPVRTSTCSSRSVLVTWQLSCLDWKHGREVALLAGDGLPVGRSSICGFEAAADGGCLFGECHYGSHHSRCRCHDRGFCLRWYRGDGARYRVVCCVFASRPLAPVG